MNEQTAIQEYLLDFIQCNSELASAIDTTTDLIDSAAIDSLLVADLTSQIESVFGVTLSVRDISPDNFRTVELLAQLVVKKRAKKKNAA